MRSLILVKHSQPAIEPAVSAKDWRLSLEGRRRCVALAQRLSSYQPTCIIASTEPKASETAQLIAAKLNLPWHTAADLHEHDRSNEPFHSPEEFRQFVANFFARPDDLLFGQETANEALARFTQATEHVLGAHPEGNLAIVAHGTVISLLVAAHNPIEPFVLWQQLTMPSFVVLSLPKFALLERVDYVAGVQGWCKVR